MRAFLTTYPLSLLCLVVLVWASLTSRFPEMPLVEQVPFYDKWAHFLLYAVLCTVIWFEYFRSGRRSIKAALIGVVVLPALFGGLMELAQAYLTTWRTGDWMDALANSVGVLIGLALSPAIKRLVIACQR